MPLQEIHLSLWSTDLEAVRTVPLLCAAPTNRVHLAVSTNMQYSQCKNGTMNANWQAAFMGIHLTSKSSAYIEVRG